MAVDLEVSDIQVLLISSSGRGEANYAALGLSEADGCGYAASLQGNATNT